MPQLPIEWYDHDQSTKERKILTSPRYHVPGLRMIGHQNTTRATAPLPIHYHKNCFEFTYVVQGNLTFSVNGESHPLSGGDLFITQPDEIHDTGNTPMSLHQIYWFQLDISRPDALLNFTPTLSQWLIDQLLALPSRVVRMEGSTEALCKGIFSNLDGASEVEQAQACAMLGVLLCQIVKNSKLPEGSVTSDISRTTEYIHHHIYDKISMDTLAAEAMLSVPRFKQKFKAQIGTSPRNYVNYHKIELAKKLLREGKNVTNVAMDLGFSGSDYFSVVFKRYTFVSPTDYLRQVCTAEAPE